MKDLNSWANLHTWLARFKGWQEVRNPYKIGRNEACPCGSGKKYKKCCREHAEMLHELVIHLAVLTADSIAECQDFISPDEFGLSPMHGELRGVTTDFIYSCLVKAVDETLPFLRDLENDVVTHYSRALKAVGFNYDFKGKHFVPVRFLRKDGSVFDPGVPGDLSGETVKLTKFSLTAQLADGAWQALVDTKFLVGSTEDLQEGAG